MYHDTAALQSAFDKTATVLNFAYTVADRLYWLDNNFLHLGRASASLRGYQRPLLGTRHPH